MTVTIARPSAPADDETLIFKADLPDALAQSVIATVLGGTIVYWSHFAETVYGWSRAEALGQNAAELLVPEVSAAQGHDIMARLREGQSWSGEFIEGSIDISARSRAEDAQAGWPRSSAPRKMRSSTRAWIGTISDWNEGAQILYGYTAAEIVGQPLSLLMPPERGAEAAEILARSIAGGESLGQFETVRLHRDRRRLDMSVSITPIRARNGAIVGAVGIGRNTSKRKKAEAALAYPVCNTDCVDWGFAPSGARLRISRIFHNRRNRDGRLRAHVWRVVGT